MTITTRNFVLSLYITTSLIGGDANTVGLERCILKNIAGPSWNLNPCITSLYCCDGSWLVDLLSNILREMRQLTYHLCLSSPNRHRN